MVRNHRVNPNDDTAALEVDKERDFFEEGRGGGLGGSVVWGVISFRESIIVGYFDGTQDIT